MLNVGGSYPFVPSNAEKASSFRSLPQSGPVLDVSTDSAQDERVQELVLSPGRLLASQAPFERSLALAAVAGWTAGQCLSKTLYVAAAGTTQF